MKNNISLVGRYYLLFVYYILFCAGILPAKMIYVKVNANGNNNGADWTNAYNHLQDALQNAQLGDAILIAQGYYYPNTNTQYPNGTKDRTLSFTLKNGVTLAGGFAGDPKKPLSRNPSLYKTYLSGDIGILGNTADNSYHVLYANAVTNATVDGVYIIYGNANASSGSNASGGGLYLYNCSPEINNCQFKFNEAHTGGAIYGAIVSPNITECRFEENSSSQKGGAIYVAAASSPTLEGCTFYNNISNYGGALYSYNGMPDLINCVFDQNMCYFGGGALYYEMSNGAILQSIFCNNVAIPWESPPPGGALYCRDSNPQIINSVFWNNFSMITGGIYGNSAPAITNTILWNNGSSNLYDQIDCTSASVNYCCIEGWDGSLGGTGNIAADPLFADPVNLNFNLAAGSGGIDAGQNAALGDLLMNDFYGNPRYGNDPATPDTGSGAAPIIDIGVAEIPSPSVIFVRTDAPGPDHDGSSWSKAYLYLQDALEVAVAGQQIWIAKGAYKPDQSKDHPSGTGNRDATFDINDGIALYGGFAGNEDPETYDLAQRQLQLNESILSGNIGSTGTSTDNSYSIATLEGVGGSVVINGCLFQEAWADGTESKQKMGGALYCDGVAPIMSQCIVRNCHSIWHGAGIYTNNCDPVILDCIFRFNTIDTNYGGAGLFCGNGTLKLEQCLFQRNQAKNGGALHVLQSEVFITESEFFYNQGSYGGGAHFYGCPSVTLDRCVFSGNQGFSGGALSAQWDSFAMYNCLFYNNTADLGGAVYIWETSSARAANCTLVDNTANQGGGLFAVNNTVDVSNTILWNNQARMPEVQDNQLKGGGSYHYNINYCCVQGWSGSLGGAGNTGNDPRFYDSDVQDYHLRPGSPCIDAGDNDTLPDFATLDLDGRNRFYNDPFSPNTGHGISPLVDMGAYEYRLHYRVRPPLPTPNPNPQLNDDVTEFTNLQDALTAAQTGDAIWVSAGTYTPDQGGLYAAGDQNATFRLNKGVRLYGGFPVDNDAWESRNPTLHETILSGDLAGDDGPNFTNYTDNCLHVLDGSGTDQTTILNGFTISGGNAGPNYHPANKGGGIIIFPGSPTIKLCHFTANSAAGHRGGAIFNKSDSNPWITQCRFTANRAGEGGAICNEGDCSPLIENCEFTGNAAVATAYGYGSGGAIHNRANSNPIIRRCRFIDNTSNDDAGGIMNYSDCHPTIEQCLFSGNASNDKAGAVYDRTYCASTLKNCTFYNNQAAYGGALYAWEYCTGFVLNSIFFKNAATYGPELASHNRSNVRIDYCCIDPEATLIDGNSQIQWGVGNISEDPRFVNAAAGDFHLLSKGWYLKNDSWAWSGSTSRCIDAGCPGSPLQNELATVPSDPSNTYGINLRINMGIYGGTDQASMPPHHWALLSDYDNDGIAALTDFNLLSNTWLSTDSYLPGDTNRNAATDPPDMQLLVEDWLATTTWH